MSDTCEKHSAKPAKIYCKCVGCEIDNLNQRIREQEELLKWFRLHCSFTSAELPQAIVPTEPHSPKGAEAEA